MPRARGSPATQEEYEEWLGRLEEEESLPDDYELFQKKLAGELYGFNDAQIQKLWELKGNQNIYAEHGVSMVTIRYPWGSELRYGVQGLSGLWGWERIQELRNEEGW